MERSLIRKEVLPFLGMFGALLLSTMIIDALLHLFDLVWVGRYLGITGTILILLSFFYSMRKRKLITVGKPGNLLILHETLTWLGALMILVHAGVHVYTILPWLALTAMLVNVISGMTGKYLLDRSRRFLAEKKTSYARRGLTDEAVEKELFGKERKNVSFHRKLIAQDCIACHSDHKGVQAFRPISQFSHQLLEPAVQEQCDGYHSNPGDNLHQDIKGNCGQCHTEESWVPATFDHDEYFRFDREHTTKCRTCHINNDYSNYTCYGCHEHSRSNIREEHVEEGIHNYENCEECHRSGDEDEAEYLWKAKRLRSGEGKNNSRRPDLKWKERKHHDDEDDD